MPVALFQWQYEYALYVWSFHFMFSQLDSLPIFCSKVAGKISVSGNKQKEIKLAKHRESLIFYKKYF